MQELLAAVDFGTVAPPPGIERLGTGPGGIITLLNIILRLLVVVGGIYALINIIIAGYGFISAGGDPKAIESAWAKIWQSILGLTIIAGSFLLAAIFGQLIFGNPGAILNPKLYVPDSTSQVIPVDPSCESLGKPPGSVGCD